MSTSYFLHTANTSFPNRAVEKVLGYLHRLVAAGTGSSAHLAATAARGGPAYRHLGLMASVALSRLECLLGDYTSSLLALGPIFDPSAPMIPVGDGGEMRTAEEVVQSVIPARISMSYHAGVSYLLLRRYRDAAATLGSIGTYMQRGFKTGQLRGSAATDQYGRQYDRVLALLAILGHVCPHLLADAGVVEDSVARIVRERHASQLTKIESGEEGYEELFVFACPKFISANVPDYNRVLIGGGDAKEGSDVPTGQDAYRRQVRHFTSEMDVQSTLRKLRSYMRLYTSIDVGKLAAFNDVKAEDLGPLLLTYKHKTRQLQCTTTGGKDAEADPAAPDAAATTKSGPAGGLIGDAALDVHYYVNDTMVHVEEAEQRQRRFESYFLGQMEQNAEILRDAEDIDTVV